MAAVPTNGTVEFNILFNGSDGQNPATGSENGGDPSAPENLGKPNASDPTSSNSGTVSASAGVHVAMNLGKQAVDSAVSNIGLATGNNYAQNQVQNAIAGISTGVGLMASFTNPFTAIAAVGSLLISGISSAWANTEQRRWQNLEAQSYARLYGFTSDEGR